MYDQAYDEYMRSVLGNPYSMMPQDLYGMNMMNTYMPNETQEAQMINEELEECYPEIYKTVYPMVQKACMRNTKPITKRLIDDLVNDIYLNIEQNDSININVNLGNTSKINNISSERDARTTTLSRNDVKPEVREIRNEARPKETRQNNFLLNDLIKILVLRELIGMPGRHGNRPPQRPPMRPPYPGARPPMRTRMEFNPNYDYYEY